MQLNHVKYTRRRLSDQTRMRRYSLIGAVRCLSNCALLAGVCVAVPAADAAVSMTPLTGPGLTPLPGGGWWDADLGVPIGSSAAGWWLVLGDVLGSLTHARVPSAIGYVNNATQQGFHVKWESQLPPSGKPAATVG